MRTWEKFHELIERAFEGLPDDCDIRDTNISDYLEYLRRAAGEQRDRERKAVTHG